MASRYSRIKPGKSVRFRLRGYHPLWLPRSSGIPLTNGFVTFPSNVKLSRSRTIIISTPAPSACANGPGLGSSLFARRYLGNNCCSLFLRLLRCFTSASLLLDSTSRCPAFCGTGFPIRTSPDHRLLRTYPRRIAATLRPSSLHGAKASAIHPYAFLFLSLIFPLGRVRGFFAKKSAMVFLPQETDFSCLPRKTTKWFCGVFCFLCFSLFDCQRPFKKNRLSRGETLRNMAV